MKQFLLAGLVGALFIHCTAENGGNTMSDMGEGLFAELKTDKGDIVLKLEYEKTPMTAANFAGLAEGKIENDAKKKGEPYYDGTVFHRVIDGFMIQGGDPAGTGRGGPGYRFPDEIVSSLKHDKAGILSMANAGPGTNGSQFFITHVPTPHLDGKHTVFGHVVKGMDVVNAIEKGDRLKKAVIYRNGEKAEAFKTDKEAFNLYKKESGEKMGKTKEKENKNFVEKTKEKFPDAIKDSDGFMYVTHKEGKGPAPEQGDLIKVHYTGTLMNGKKFDSSLDRNKPFEFPVGTGKVIKGWDKAFLKMKKGEKRTIILPSDLAYGSRGVPGVIPPNSVLVFDVELIEF